MDSKLIFLLTYYFDVLLEQWKYTYKKHKSLERMHSVTENYKWNGFGWIFWNFQSWKFHFFYLIGKWLLVIMKTAFYFKVWINFSSIKSSLEFPNDKCGILNVYISHQKIPPKGKEEKCSYILIITYNFMYYRQPTIEFISFFFC